GPGQRHSNPVFGRLDAVIDFASPCWKDTLLFLEPNLSCMGGLHLVPMAERIVAEVVLPALQSEDAALALERGTDVRELLAQEMLDHWDHLGRPDGDFCLIEPKYADSGPDEQRALAHFFQERFDLKVWHADPTELRLRDEEVYYGDRRVSVAYRDYPIADLIALEAQGADVGPMRTLFRQNRVLSSISALFDHKSCWEVLTDPLLAGKYFTPEEQEVFHRHVPWTRSCTARLATLPHGQEGPLLAYVCQDQEFLVLKPDRAFGGEGVILGKSVTRAEWQAALHRALADVEPWVVQELATIPVHDFPVAEAEGKVHLRPFYTVMGFSATRYGLAVLGRASPSPVVNVAQGGGMFAVLVGHRHQDDKVTR
ncbi:MAG: hypothetical protein JO112_14125, partial [Planctomycetes bacterium]|nr:hypothetical protein [Planctomycetota bacterium]